MISSSTRLGSLPTPPSGPGVYRLFDKLDLTDEHQQALNNFGFVWACRANFFDAISNFDKRKLYPGLCLCSKGQENWATANREPGVSQTKHNHIVLTLSLLLIDSSKGSTVSKRQQMEWGNQSQCQVSPNFFWRLRASAQIVLQNQNVFVVKEKPTEENQNRGAETTVSPAVGHFPQMTPENHQTFTLKQGFQPQQNLVLGRYVVLN